MLVTKEAANAIQESVWPIHSKQIEDLVTTFPIRFFFFLFFLTLFTQQTLTLLTILAALTLLITNTTTYPTDNTHFSAINQSIPVH